jgi:hypothetical protein
MNATRRKRLLILTEHPRSDHKRRFAQYLTLVREGLIIWRIGHAYLTEKGVTELAKIKSEKP